MELRRRAGGGGGDRLSEAAPAGEARLLPPLPEGWQAVRYAVLADGSLAVIAANADLAGAWARVRAAGDRATATDRRRPYRLASAATAQVHRLDHDAWIAGPRFGLETPFSSFDRFADGRWLVVADRSGSEPNARLIAPDGTLAGRFMLGDGIEHVAVDSGGRIWVGWFDEGVSGNSAWRVPGRERPPSANGVGVFGTDGSVLPELRWPEPVEAPVADCYALNVGRDDAWACPYVDFPLVHLRPSRAPRWWRNTLAGVRAIAVGEGAALLAAGYADDADRLALVALDGRGRGEDAPVVATWRMPLRASSDRFATNAWAHPDLLAGRGDTIHLVDAGRWHRWRVGALQSRG